MREGRSAFFLFLPDGMDPDDYVRRQGQDQFQAEVDRAIPLSRYLFEHLGANLDLGTVEGRSRLVEQCRPLLAKVPAGSYRELLSARLAELAHLDPERLSTGRGWHPVRTKPDPRSRVAGIVAARHPSLVRRALHLLIHAPALATSITDDPERAARLRALNRPGIDLLADVLDLLVERPDLTTGAVLEHFRDHELGKYLRRLAGESPPVLVTEASARDSLPPLTEPGQAGSEAGSPRPRRTAPETLVLELEEMLSRLDQALSEQRYDTLASKSGPLTESEKEELRVLLAARRTDR